MSYEDINGNGIIKAEDEIKEENHYYPFGLKHKGYNSQITGRNHNYGFGGKEEQNELGLEWIDITARNYDPALGRWMNIDPLAEDYYEWSPYNYVYNSPLQFIDPTGMGVEEIVLDFQNEKAKKSYETIVNEGMGGFYKIITDSEGKVSLESTGKEGEMTEKQKAFYDQYKAVVDSEIVVEQKVMERSVDTNVGSWAFNKIDMADVEAFDEAGEGGATSAGAVIHETVEQFEKAKKGYKKGELATGAFLAAHAKAILAEDKVNGNTRNGDEFTEKDGTITVQRIIRNTTTGRNKVTKKKKEKKKKS